MEAVILSSVGIIGFLSYLKRKENFNDSNTLNNPDFNPVAGTVKGTSYDRYSPDLMQPYVGSAPFNDHNQMLTDNTKFIEQNCEWNKQTIDGIELKDYYNKYFTKVLKDGTWLLNQHMPVETKQALVNKDEESTVRRMRELTGTDQTFVRDELGVPSKMEIKPLFTPEERTVSAGYTYGGNRAGLQPYAAQEKEKEDYRETIKYKTNEKPVERAIIGRGLALDASIPAGGGVHDYTRVMPNNVSGYKANQLPGRFSGGKWAVSSAPAAAMPVNKNKPNTFYSLCQRGPMPGGGMYDAPMTIPDYAVNLKFQNRQTTNAGFGVNLNSFLCEN